ncbi:DUF6157 family protein [Cohnella caldifontis]|uniref:DUF6157 family protein n=1 Tax=Cohnella caldifontis TaxID=3027471 RepID=UPI0023EBB2E3|nr:DUF6157 family protein [Cohnella sp. YIM B05605]
MELNYYDTFITVAADCPVERGIVPPERKNGKTKPAIEFELASEQPYRYTQEELLFKVYAQHKGISDAELSERGEALKAEFFGKPQACMRASMLPKKYGWGIHFNSEGKLALYPMESPEYRRFIDGEAGNVRLVPAMRSSRK